MAVKDTHSHQTRSKDWGCRASPNSSLLRLLLCLLHPRGAFSFLELMQVSGERACLDHRPQKGCPCFIFGCTNILIWDTTTPTPAASIMSLCMGSPGLQYDCWQLTSMQLVILQRNFTERCLHIVPTLALLSRAVTFINGFGKVTRE